MSHIMKCDKYATQDAHWVNEAQQLIRKLSRPIGEISTLIQECLQLVEQHKTNVILKKTPTPHTFYSKKRLRLYNLGIQE